MKKLVAIACGLCFVAAVFMLALACFAPPSAQLPLSGENTLSTINEGWLVTINGEVLGLVDLPVTLETPPGSVVVAQRDVKSRSGNAFVGLRTEQTELRAYVDGVMVYSYGLGGPSPPGNAWNFVNVAGGSRVMLEFIPWFDDASITMLPALVGGSRHAIFYQLFSANFASAFLSLLSVVAGLLIICLGLIASFRLKSKSFILLGVFCTLISVWSLEETGLLDLFIPHPRLITLIDYLSLFVAPLFMLLFVRSVYTLQNNRFCNLFVLVYSAIVSVFTLLHMVQIIFLWDVLWVAHLLIIAVALYTLWAAMRFRMFMERINNLLFLFAICCLSLFSVIDLLHYYILLDTTATSGADSAFFIRIGFILFIILLTIVNLRQGLVLYNKGVEAEVLQKMLETDLMTGLCSRHTFDADMEALARQPDEELTDVFLLMFDINNLKKVNESQGHKQGDLLLTKAAHLLQDVFGHYGKCYRIGGDECVAILRGVTPALLEERIALLESRAQTVRNNAGPDIDVAMGYAQYTPGLDNNIYALFTRVDSIMYQDKRNKMQAGVLPIA